MAHLEVEPAPLDLGQCSLSRGSLRLARGRICGVTLRIPDWKGAAINVYQFQASLPRQQESLLGTLHTLITYLLHNGYQRVFVTGDFNACFPGERKGYSNTSREMDETFRTWTHQAQLQAGISRP